MHQKTHFWKSILVTGGTSGLGLELVKRFLAEGYEVIATGRQQTDIGGFPGRFFLYIIDFGDLLQVKETTATICRDHSVSMIINNAGILSPPSYTETVDGLEYTFQINFLAHFLMNQIILQSHKDERPLVIVSITSPVYRLAGSNAGIIYGAGDYNAMRSYSSSKLFLAMMHEFLGTERNDSNFRCFSFNPGTFRSAIYRTQKSWFRGMYRIAAPFMRSPSRVARVLSDLLMHEEPEDGMIYDISKRKKALPSMDESHKNALFIRCRKLIDPYLRQIGSLK